VADGKTLEAIIANRYEVMAKLRAEMRARWRRTRRVCSRRRGPRTACAGPNMRLAKAWLHRDDDKIPQGVKPQLQKALGDSPKLAKLVAMREELRQLWTRTNVSAEQLVADLQAWCREGRGQRHCRAAGVLVQPARGARLSRPSSQEGPPTGGLFHPPVQRARCGAGSRSGKTKPATGAGFDVGRCQALT
jgi:hypothetical protein